MRYFITAFVIICNLIFTALKLPAQDAKSVTITPRFDKLTVDNGLSQGYVGCSIQDSEGFLWFGTQDGLNKYDGYSIKVYRYNEREPYSLPDNGISQIAEDKRGNIWVATKNKGLFLFNRSKEEFYPVLLSTISNTENPIILLKCQNDKLLVADIKDISIYDIKNIAASTYNPKATKHLQRVFSYNSLQTNPLKKWAGSDWYLPYWLPDNSVWMPDSAFIYTCTPDSTLKKWNFSSMHSAQFGMDKQLVCKLFDGATANKIVFVGSGRLTVYDKTQNRIIYTYTLNDHGLGWLDYFYNRPFSLGNGKIILMDSVSWFHFNSADYQIKRYGPCEANKEGGFGGKSILLSNDGNIWIGTGGYGLYKYNSQIERFHFLNESLFGFTSIPNNKSEIYINKRTVGWRTFNTTTKSTSPIIPESLLSKNKGQQYLYLTDKDSILWVLLVSDKTQLIKYNFVKQTIEDCTRYYSKEIYFNEHLPFFTDNKNDFWRFSYDENGNRLLLHFDRNTLLLKAKFIIPLSTGKNGNALEIFNTFQDNDGIFWLGTNDGLIRFNQNKNEWKHFNNNPTDTNSLSSDIIFSICPDPTASSKYLWIGTNGRGFNRFEIATGKCIRYSDKDGLPNNVVYGILSDEAGNLWMSTNVGLSCFTPGGSRGAFRNFTYYDGLAGNEFNRGQFYKKSNGELIFGGVAGITWFNPKTVLENLLPPSQIVITGFSIANKIVNYKQDSSVLKTPIQYAESITLPYDKNMFSFDFALLQFTSPEKKHYRYYLENFDKEWIDNGSKNTATFTNIEPGEYVFHVTGSNSDGVWNKVGATIKIIITPPWWATWWFRLLITALFVSTIYAVYQYRIQQTLKLQKIRNRIANDLHDEIGSTLSSISMFGEVARKNISTKPEQSGALLDQINYSTAEMMESMSDIVWTINTGNDKFNHITNRMRAFAVQVLEAKGIAMHMNVNAAFDNLSLDMVQRKNIYLIFKEAINNASKYAECKNVWIDITLLNNKKMLLKVKDDGKGIITNSAGKEQVHNFGGNGINNMKKRAEELNGTLSVTSNINEGTCIELSFLL